MAQLRRLAAVALLLVGAEADFLSNLKKFEPPKITVPVLGKSPEELAMAVSQKVAKTIPTEVTSKISQAGLENAAEKVKDHASEIQNAAGGMQDAAQQKITTAVDTIKSSDVAEQAGQVAEAASQLPESLGSSVQGVEESLSAVQVIKPEELASAVREATPQAAAAVQSGSLQAADAMKLAAPQAAAALNRTGHSVADKIDGHGGVTMISPEGIPVDATEVPDAAERGWAPLSGVVLLVLTAAAGYMLVARYKGNQQRSPLLMSDEDALQGVGSARSIRNPMDGPQSAGFQQM